MDDINTMVARAICNSLEADDFDKLPKRSIERAAYLQQAEAAIVAVRRFDSAESERELVKRLVDYSHFE